MKHFDFNHWAELAQTDPEAFDRQRRLALEGHISGMDKARQPRMQKLQFRIDMERRRAHTPLKSCLRLSSMMWDSFHEMQEILAAGLDGRRKVREQETAPSGNVIPFPAGKSHSGA